MSNKIKAAIIGTDLLMKPLRSDVIEPVWMVGVHPGALDLLVNDMGEDRVLLGSDYPLPLGEQDIGSLVAGQEKLGEQGRRKIMGDNALAFFGIDP